MTLDFWQLLLAAETSPAKGRALYEAFGPSSVISQAEFAAHKLLTPAEAARVGACSTGAPLAAGASWLALESRPPLLCEDEEAPIAVLTVGTTACLFEPCVAIVGTRNASTYGKVVARKFAAALAGAGATVVSGGAVGIDAAAHEGALGASGATTAVLAGGVDKPYPSQNVGLFRRMRERGCQLSAYACGTMADRHKFLERNAVIAALSLAVIVIEAPERSGALSTATAARRLGRPIFVVPANIEATSFRGSHALIREGATLVDDPQQVLDALGLAAPAPALERAVLDGLPGRIVAALTTKPISSEKLADALQIAPAELLSELTMLELDGRVIRDQGGYALVP